MPATAVRLADFIMPTLDRVLGYAPLLAKDIPARQFAHMPHPNMNHPAFCFGHLSLYPDRLLGMLGRADLAQEKAGWQDLFKAGVACVEQDGRYPDKDEIVNGFMDRHAVLRDVLPIVDDEVFARPNPIEGRMRELFPTVGAATTFMLGAHNMMHLGQVSAWRRAMGLPSAM